MLGIKQTVWSNQCIKVVAVIYIYIYIYIYILILIALLYGRAYVANYHNQTTKNNNKKTYGPVKEHAGIDQT